MYSYSNHINVAIALLQLMAPRMTNQEHTEKQIKWVDEEYMLREISMKRLQRPAYS